MLPSWQEMVPVLIILIIIFGARKLPEIGSGLGKGIKEFKKAVKDADEADEKKPIETEAKTGDNSEKDKARKEG